METLKYKIEASLWIQLHGEKTLKMCWKKKEALKKSLLLRLQLNLVGRFQLLNKKDISLWDQMNLNL